MSAAPAFPHRPPLARPLARAPARARRRWMWLAALLAATCFEGLGRKFLPMVPSVAFYFLKDVVLAWGIAAWARSPDVVRVTRRYLGGFLVVGMAAVFWTFMEMFNPDQRSMPLGVVGMRGYWLWFLAPVVIASYLRSEEDLATGVKVLTGLVVVVCGFAALQFTRPGNDALNTYALYEGREMNDVDVMTEGSVASVRVSSTFSYLSGFSNFCILVPPLLLALALQQQRGRMRNGLLAVIGLAAATTPMHGSRGGVALAIFMLAAVGWGAGLLATRAGRRMVLGAGGAVVVATLASPAAFEALQRRFRNPEETAARVAELGTMFPPVALARYDYSVLGAGTGMGTNAASALGVRTVHVEAEASRVLYEHGPVGYLLVWLTRFGLAVTLYRAYRRLKASAARPFSGLALGYAVVGFFGPLLYDHVFNALYFMGVAFILRYLVWVEHAEPRRAVRPVVAPPRTQVPVVLAR